MKKKLITGFLMLFVITISLVSNVRADYKDFSGSAGYSYARVSGENGKGNKEYFGGIRWKTSNKTGHKMWFSIRNSNNEDRGTILIDRPNDYTVYVEVTTRYGYNYTLSARREHIINPSTYVTGTWQP